MGLLTPSDKERLLLQKQFAEKCRLIGVEGFYWEVKDHHLSKTGKWDNMEFFDPIPINFLFEDMPNPKTLRNLHWWDDNDDTTPPIAYLPWHVNRGGDHVDMYELKPSVGSKIELPDPLGGESRFYEIVEVNANTIYLIYSIVKLTPLRQTVETFTNVIDTADGKTPVEEINEPTDTPVPTEAKDETLAPGITDYQIIKKREPDRYENRQNTPEQGNIGYSFLNVDGKLKR